MIAEIKKLLADALTELNFPLVDFSVVAAANLSHGDYAANVALILAKVSQRPVNDIAKQIVQHIFNVKDSPSGHLKVSPWLGKVEVAGAGFINFFLAPEFFNAALKKILSERDDYGRGRAWLAQKVIIEYTDPNPFKEFHIGHLMSNAIGETISRLIEFQGAAVKRACYQGDVGLHVAKALYGMRLEETNFPKDNVPLAEKAAFLGRAYVAGATEPTTGKDNWQNSLRDLNQLIYERSNEAVNRLYDWGRRVSLEYFETIYQRLGTKFDYYFFESNTGEFGKKLVAENLGRVFESSAGAIIFPAEKYDPKLHTRVFLTKDGLPTYEAKELGLAKIKFGRFAYDRSIIITGNEIADYFAVLLKALALIFPDLAAKTTHLGHGMLRLSSGKISSRTGAVVTAENLLAEVKTAVNEKLAVRDFDPAAREKIAEAVAVAAIKYAILKQAPARDVIFNLEQSLSLEGDSGPYLQYTLLRARAVIEKGNGAGISTTFDRSPIEPGELIRRLVHFSEIVDRASRLYAPNLLVTYLTELAAAFNHYYAAEQIIGADPGAPYRLALTQAVAIVLANGLKLLAIPIPDRM